MQAVPFAERVGERARVLVIGADSATRRTLSRFFAERQIDVWEAESTERGLVLVRRRPVDVVVACPDVAGAEHARLVSDVQTFDDRIGVIAVVDSAARGHEALAAGAYDYFLEPVDLTRLDVVFHHVYEAVVARERSELLAQQCDGPARIGRLVTQDPRVIAAFAAARRLARYDTPLLIVGPAGSGKESLARALHESGRPGAPFVHVDGATLTPESLERASSAARGGTLFVTDVHALGPETAAALVATLDRGEGGMRVIGAAQVAAGRRTPGTPGEDLALRLSETVLELPPLGERPGDVVPIARELLRARDREHEAPELTRSAGEALRAHGWPGNVDELSTVLDSARAAAGGQAIEARHLPGALATASLSAAVLESRKLADIEAVHLRQVLAETRGNKARAARILGVSRWALQRRLQKHRIAAGESLS